MGGNLVLKLAGEWGKQGPPEFRAVAACCPALDLATSADTLHNRRNRIYETYFLRKLRRRMLHKARLFPDRFDTKRLNGIRSLREFDDKVTAYYCGFAGAVDYYDRASAAHVVGQIAVPALVLHAANDPFIRITPQTRQKLQANPNITFLESQDGGHCAFIGARISSAAGTENEAENSENYSKKFDDGFWAETTIVDFLRRF
jgi:predicted alpha/beta-fold hydrolase